ncbi:MAG: DUF3592 domain-containing protein [Pseudomonadota bacterium]
MSRAPWPVIAGLSIFVLIALAMVFFGMRMTLYRVDQRALAEPATAMVIETDSRVVTSRDSDGRTTSTTEYSYLVEIGAGGDTLQRPLIAANFDRQDTWFTSDEVDPDAHLAGSTVPVLVRADLGHAVTPAGFWAAYAVPVILMGFGGFILAFLSLWCWLFFRR